jgi:hypothetical protein
VISDGGATASPGPDDIDGHLALGSDSSLFAVVAVITMELSRRGADDKRRRSVAGKGIGSNALIGAINIEHGDPGSCAGIEADVAISESSLARKLCTPLEPDTLRVLHGWNLTLQRDGRDAVFGEDRLILDEGPGHADAFACCAALA